LCALAACSLGEALIGEPGKVEGCMYMRGRPVHISCLNKLITEGGLSRKELAACILERERSAVGASTFFTLEGGRQESFAACYFERGDRREYYRYEPEEKKVLVRTLTCAGGCKSETRVYSITFGEEYVIMEKLDN
jgi:hypothetical protein